MAQQLSDRIADRIVEFFTGLGGWTDGNAPTNSLKAPDLATRLFCECENRHRCSLEKTMENTASGLKARSVFFHERVLIFAKPSQNTMNMHVWLETIFGLEVVVVHEHAMFNEWLYRHVASVDFLIAEQGSFTDDSAFSRFIVKAREIADDLPLIVMGSNFRSNDFEPSWHDPWDISMRIPVSQVSCWMSVKTAADITLHGRM